MFTNQGRPEDVVNVDGIDTVSNDIPLCSFPKYPMIVHKSIAIDVLQSLQKLRNVSFPTIQVDALFKLSDNQNVPMESTKAKSDSSVELDMNELAIPLIPR